MHGETRIRARRRTVSAFIGFVVAGSFGLGSCATNPYTEQSQLLFISVSQAMQLGGQAYAQVLHDPKVGIARDSGK